MNRNLKSICVRVRLKPDSIPRVRTWASEIISRKEEAFETLRTEGVYVESVFLEQTSEGDFLIYYLLMESLEKASEAVKSSPYLKDLYHKQFKIDCWESREELELLVDLDRSSER